VQEICDDILNILGNCIFCFLIIRSVLDGV